MGDEKGRRGIAIDVLAQDLVSLKSWNLPCVVLLLDEWAALRRHVVLIVCAEVNTQTRTFVEGRRRSALKYNVWIWSESVTDRAEGTVSAVERSAPICPTSFSSFSRSEYRQNCRSSGCLGQCNKTTVRYSSSLLTDQKRKNKHIYRKYDYPSSTSLNLFSE